MATVQTSLLDEARGLLDDTIELRRRIHRHPEIGLTLPRTQQSCSRRWRRSASTSAPAARRRRSSPRSTAPGRGRRCCCVPTWTRSPYRRRPTGVAMHVAVALDFLNDR